MSRPVCGDRLRPGESPRGSGRHGVDMKHMTTNDAPARHADESTTDSQWVLFSDPEAVKATVPHDLNAAEATPVFSSTY